ncbi:Heat-labile enterotoxin IIB, A chain [Metarhizium anisopliae]|nr:Heat-labile enterotoxin IIB, A chain [Metarhizium anisopliae]
MKTIRRILTTALALSLGLCQGHAKHGLSSNTTIDRRQTGGESTYGERAVMHVYRGEIRRTPEQVKQDGGFYSRGVQRILSGNPPSVEELELGSSLYRHAAGDTAEFTRYVSTSTDPGVSLTFAVDDERPTGKGYIYKIHASQRLVDLNRSLGKYSPYPGQHEYVAMEFIPFEQVEGWWTVTYQDDFSEPAIGRQTRIQLREGNLRGFHQNPDFDNSFKYARTGGMAPQLAGFPRLSAAWEDRSWQEYKTIPVSKSLDDMIGAACAGKASCRLERITPKVASWRFNKLTKSKALASNGPIDPTKQRKPFSGFRVYGKAATLVGIQALAPHMRQVLHWLREWDHPIGHAVRWIDDHINELQQIIGGPPRSDISGNDNQAALINFFKYIFWLLQGSDRTSEQLDLLSYGEKTRRRLVSVNDILRTCDRVDEQPPEDGLLRDNLQESCSEMRDKAMEVEGLTEEEVVVGRNLCSSCQTCTWEPEHGLCRDKAGTIVWPREPLPEGDQYAPTLQTGENPCKASRKKARRAAEA